MKKYWFKRRRYGYGWQPVTWQGVAVIGGYLLAILTGMLVTMRTIQTVVDDLFYVVMVAAASVTLVQITKKHAPPAKWRWGKKPHDNPDEDI